MFLNELHTYRIIDSLLVFCNAIHYHGKQVLQRIKCTIVQIASTLARYSSYRNVIRQHQKEPIRIVRVDFIPNLEVKTNDKNLCSETERSF